MKQQVLTLASIVFISSCSSVYKAGDSAPTSVSEEAKTVAAKEDATYVTEIYFEKNSAMLTTGDREKLDSIISQAKASGKIDDVKVITWSDQEYPSKSKDKLSKMQRDLANRRISHIKDYLKETDSSLDVDTFNMAARPNALSTLFNTENNRVKKSLETAGISKSNAPSEGTEKAGKSMIMVILK